MKWREVVVAAALWAVLFIPLRPNTTDSVRTVAFGVVLAVLAYAAVRIVARILGAK